MKKLLALFFVSLVFFTGCNNTKDLEKDNTPDEGIIENVKMEAAKNNAYDVIAAVRLYTTEALLDPDSHPYSSNGNDATTLVVAGFTVTSGTWDYNNGVISLNNVVINEYTCSGTVNNMICEK